MAGFLGLGSGEGSFFLDPDDAKSYGDIDYMRTAKKVKRTYPTTKGWGKVEPSEKNVSAYDEKKGIPQSTQSTGSFSYTPSTPTAAEEQGSTSQPESTSTPARKLDSNMDMFRQMARKIK